MSGQRAVEAERDRLQAELWHQAYHDPLTGLPNRRNFDTHLQEALDRVEETGESLAVVLFDLDGFKTLNDACGPGVGDELLQAVANRIHAQVRGLDLFARLGGDEFGVLLSETAAEQVERVVERLLATLQEPFTVTGRRIYIGASFGISRCPADDRQGSALIERADLALYQTKAAGRGSYRFYTDALRATVTERVELDQALRSALAQEALAVVYQPQVELTDGRIVGVEALVRWPHPDKGWLTPNQFLSVAETAGLLSTLGEQMLQMACT